MATYKNYTVQVEVEMHDGPSINDVVVVRATSEEDAINIVDNDDALRASVADRHGGHEVVMCVDPQLAMEGHWVSVETWLSEMFGNDLE